MSTLSDPSPVAAAAGLTELELVEDHGAVAHYSAMSAEQGRRVSVWRALPSAFADARGEQRFVEAAKESMRLGSACISPPLSLTGASGGGHWLCADLPRGMTLDDVISLRGKLALDDVVLLAQVLCEALNEVHDAGLVHHGLRPHAIEVMGDVSANTVRLGDFSLGFLPLRGSQNGPNGVPLVAPAYAAPECIRGQEPSPQSDLYSLGCLLYAALIGRPPFSSSNAEEVLHDQVSTAAPRLPEAFAQLGPAISACLQKDPARRPASARDLAAMLGRANQTLMPSATPARPSARISYKALPDLPQAQPGAEVPGDLLGQYKLVRLLGEGAMGRVFLGQHLLLGRQVALKILKPEQYKKEDLIQRFFQEARTVNQINHEHIVEIIDCVIEPGKDGPRSVYCVMEALEGQTLTAVLEKGPVTLARIASLIEQVCDALAAAHRVGVTHRDVKPDNIFLTQKPGQADYVKVLDFGVAKLTSSQNEATLVSTLDGALIGTPIYMAPEQAAGQSADHRSDIYATGVILYELLCGKPPFAASNFGALAVQIITQPPPPLPERTQSGEPLPAGLRQLVMRCLEKQADARPQSMGEVRQALLALGRGEVLPSEADPAAIRRGPPMALIAGAAAAMLLLGVGGWWLTRTPAEVPVVKVDPPPIEPPPVAKVDPPPVEPPPVKVDPPPIEPPPVKVNPPPQKVLEKLGPEDVKEVVSRGQRDVQACVKRHRANLGGIRTVKVAIKVETSGKVSEANLSPADLAATPLGKCVVKEVRQFAFPRFKGKALKFEVPFSWNLSE